MGAKEHLSVTQLNMMLRCGEQYRRRYVEGEKIPPGIAVHRGAGIHKGAEFNYRQKIETRKDLPEKEIVDYAVSAFDTSLADRGYTLSTEEQKIGSKKVLAIARDSTAELASLFAKEVAPSVQPEFVEHKLVIPLPGLRSALIGILDCIAEGGVIEELKTKGKRPSQVDVDEDEQFTWYFMAFRHAFGHPPGKLVLRSLLDLKTPQVDVKTTVRDDADVQSLLNRITWMYRALKAGIFAPAPRGAWWCSDRFCGYWQTCPYVRAGAKSLVDLGGSGNGKDS